MKKVFGRPRSLKEAVLHYCPGCGHGIINRLLMEVVQRRIERAEVVILSYLLTQSDTSAQIGPYLVELDADQHVTVTKTEDDGWRQRYFPELDALYSV